MVFNHEGILPKFSLDLDIINRVRIVHGVAHPLGQKAANAKSELELRFFNGPISQLLFTSLAIRSL